MAKENRKLKKDRTDLLLKEPNLYRAFMILALPVMASNLLKSVHDLVDTYFIGQLENSVSAQAGIAVTWPLLNIFIALSSGLAVAGVAVISQQLGAGREEEARRYTALLLVLSAAVGVGITVVLACISPWVLRLMGAEGGVYREGLTYLSVRAFEMPFLFIFSAYQAVRQAKGDTTTPVILSITAIVINIVLTAVFIKVFGLGVFGAAIATLIGQAAITPVCLILMFKKTETLRVEKQYLRINKADMKNLIKVAMPSAASQALSSLGFLILQAAILSYGEVVSAAFSLGNKVSNLLLIPIMALGSVLAAFVGQNVGARNKERALASYKVSRNIALLLSIAGSLLLYPFREGALGLLTNSPETLSVAVEYVFWVLLTQPLMSLFQNYMGVFNGSGHTGFSFRIATARLWLIRLPLILIFKSFTDMGRSGIWYAMVISNLVIILYGARLFRKIDFEPITK